jgi:hypothetical protein
LRVKPDFSLALIKRGLSFRWNSAELDYYVEGLRKAGLPE